MRLQTERTAAALRMAAGAPEHMETTDQVLPDITTLFQSCNEDFAHPIDLIPPSFKSYRRVGTGRQVVTRM